MISRVVVFEDNKIHRSLFEVKFQEVGCQVLIVDTHHVEDHREKILEFGPDGAVVDSQFCDSEIDGAGVVKFLHRQMPRLPIVICSILYDKEASRERLLRTYRNAPGVRGIIGKTPFPDGSDIVRMMVN